MKKLTSNSKVCTGCRYCEAVCSMVHSDGVINPYVARIRVRDDLLTGVAAPIACRQCVKPRCVEACPHYALHQDPDLGVPSIDQSKCKGAACLACVQACPYGAMLFDERSGRPITCDLCGGSPMCVKVCRAYPHLPHAALSYE